MRTSLRRSCNACAKAKHRCDLQIPQCSRCMKRQSRCLYTNEPATSRPHDASPGTSGIKELALKNDSDFSAVTGKNNRATPIRFESLVRLENPSNEYLDPFSVYPTTRLARTHVQRLIHHCKTFSITIKDIETRASSPIKYRLPILPSGLACRFKSIPSLMVALGPSRSGPLPRLAPNSIARRGGASSKRISNLRAPYG